MMTGELPGKTYIAGPMSIVGPPTWNHPVFHEMARMLRAQGLEVVNPAELDTQEEIDAGLPWDYFLRRDLQIIAREVNRIVLLPGYEESRGARLELHVGRALNC